jgi:signal transduction histidine kinase
MTPSHEFEAVHNRHTVAKWLPPLSLRARLSLLVAAIAAVVVSAVTVLEVRSFEETIEASLLAAVRDTALAVADDLRTRPPVLDDLDVNDTLHEFAQADPVLHSISVVRLGPGQPPDFVASTQSEERDEVLALARRALDAHTVIIDRTDLYVSCAVPVEGRAAPLVAIATVSLAGIDQVRTRGRMIAMVSTVPIIVLVTLLVDITTRRLVHRPVAAIRETMARASEGETGARADVIRHDELGAVAQGLNDMLARLEHVNELQALAFGAELARAERLAALGMMAASVAHQAGTPLNLVSGYVQMMREDPAVDARVKQRLAIVDGQIAQVTRVLRTMLDQARPPLVRQLTSLSTLVTRVLELAGPRLAAANVRITADISDAIPAVDVDVVQFELALLALVSNALDAMPGGGAITIRARSVASGLSLDIADTGTGIPPDLLDRIFDPWTTTKPPGQGTGLGLGIVREVVRMHGGTISARNDPAGGAVLTIELPDAVLDGPQENR